MSLKSILQIILCTSDVTFHLDEDKCMEVHRKNGLESNIIDTVRALDWRTP